MSSSTIGRYQVLSELAQGGMGVIFLAHDPFVQRSVIIKVLTYQFAMDDFHREFFQREASIIASLEHPCIVPVYDFGWHGTQPYIVMRYMMGGSLDGLMKVQKLKLAEFSKILQRLCEALDAAHYRNIIHLDIKPANILFDVEKEAFLADFGIAQTASMGDDEENWIAGTPNYMSPEQCRFEKVDRRSDIYGLGVLLFKMLTGRLPYLAANNEALMDKHINAPIPSISAADPSLPEAWQEIINTAMAKNPAYRYPTAGALAEDVRNLVSGRWYWRKL